MYLKLSPRSKFCKKQRIFLNRTIRYRLSIREERSPTKYSSTKKVIDPDVSHSVLYQASLHGIKKNINVRLRALDLITRSWLRKLLWEFCFLSTKAL